MLIKKDYFIGDSAFYKRVFWIAMPIVIQNTVTNVVNLLDNVMVGRLGTIEMSAVAIVNQLIFIFNLCVFGGLAGSGIFSTQYAGAKDDEGLRHCFRIKLFTIAFIFLISGIVFGLFPEKLIRLYLSESTSAADASSTVNHALSYIRIMLIGLIPFSLSQVYGGSLRETGETKLPMYATTAAILVNLVFNYFLIFGKFGFPRLEVEGAAIATVMSRFVELAILVVCTHRRTDKFTFIKGVYKSLYIPAELFKKFMKKGSPLLLNEFLWSSGMALYLQCYSARGLSAVAAANIASTTTNIFNVLLISIGISISIMVGQCLGAGEVEKAKKTVWRLQTLSVTSCILLGVVLALLSGVIPDIYNTEAAVKDTASSLLIAAALTIPFDAFAHGVYFTLRSGGKTLLTFIFDCGVIWCLGVPLAYVLSNYTLLDVGVVYLLVRSLDIVKSIIGAILIRKGVWINNIVSSQK